MWEQGGEMHDFSVKCWGMDGEGLSWMCANECLPHPFTAFPKENTPEQREHPCAAGLESVYCGPLWREFCRDGVWRSLREGEEGCS
jgi:hypothetical protein